MDVSTKGPVSRINISKTMDINNPRVDVIDGIHLSKMKEVFFYVMPKFPFQQVVVGKSRQTKEKGKIKKRAERVRERQRLQGKVKTWGK